MSGFPNAILYYEAAESSDVAILGDGKHNDAVLGSLEPMKDL
jgi:hypothetical protein